MIGLPNDLPEEEIFLIILFFIACLICCCGCVARQLARRDESNQVRRLMDRRAREREERRARRNAKKRNKRRGTSTTSSVTGGSTANFDMQGLDDGPGVPESEAGSEAADKPKRSFFGRIFGRKRGKGDEDASVENQSLNSRFNEPGSPTLDRVSESFVMDDLLEEDGFRNSLDARRSIDQRLSTGQGFQFQMEPPPLRMSDAFEQPGMDYSLSFGDEHPGDEELARRLQLEEAQLAEEEAAEPPAQRTRLQFVPRD